MWGLRTIIPPTLQESVLGELQRAHPGIARMKATVCSHVWWPGIDSDIEETARRYQQCFKTRKAPPVAPLFPWSWPTAPWQRVHVDFATYQSNHYLIMVDAHSKWPEVVGRSIFPNVGPLLKLSVTAVHHSSLWSTRNFCSKMASTGYWSLLTILHPMG